MTIHRIISAFSIGILTLALVGVRYWENVLFPDPLFDYFHGDFQNLAIPADQSLHILLVTALRFLVNSLLSIGILWFLYKKIAFVKASLWVYLFAFIILMAIMVGCLYAAGDTSKMMLFYARRFLIHPITLFILIAGFYYLRNKELR